MDSMKHKAVFVLGMPGSGKGTLCKKMAQELPVVHVGASDLLKEEAAIDAEVATMLETAIKTATMVPGEVTVKLIKKAMDNQTGDPKVFLIDGFPRGIENLTSWDSVMASCCHVYKALLLECPKQLCTERCKGRSRADDDEDTIRRRLEYHRNETSKVVAMLDEQGKLQKIDASKTPQEIYKFLVDGDQHNDLPVLLLCVNGILASLIFILSLLYICNLYKVIVWNKRGFKGY